MGRARQGAWRSLAERRMAGMLGAALVALRAGNAVLVRTYFDPDEYWQCLEVAHCMVFAQCHLTWEWQPGVRIRGFAHPAVFAALYWALAALGADSREAVAFAPRLLAGALAGVGDLCVFWLGERLFGARSGRLALLCNACNWFYFYAAVRTFSNSMECVLTIAALCWWPLGGPQAGRTTLVGLGLAALAVLMRPTSALFWAYLGVRHLAQLSLPQAADLVGLQVLPVALATVAAMLAVDRLGYGEWTAVPLNFVRVNLLEGAADEYGVHGTLWYFTECMPALIGTWLPAVAIGARAAWRIPRARALLEAMLWTLVVFSVSGHKELRFALPLVPLASVLGGYGLSQVDLSARRWRLYVALACVSNAAVALYLSLRHQAAPLAVMDHLALPSTNATFVDFYTRCHATPYWSHVHGTTVRRMRFLDCSPAVAALANIPSMAMSATRGIEEEDDFFLRARELLPARLASQEPPPSHLVVSSEQFDEALLRWAEETVGYSTCATFAHTPGVSFHVLCAQTGPQ